MPDEPERITLDLDASEALSVWVDAWQQTCCGDRFEVGSDVTWMLTSPDTAFLALLLGANEAANVSHAEEHHSQGANDLRETPGSVLSIRGVSCRYGLVPGGAPNVQYPIEGSTVVTDLRSSDDRESIEDRTFVGYLVELEA